MEVVEIASGLWRWTARHPEWTPKEGGEDGWEPDVGCVYCEARDAVVLIDPLVPTEAVARERFWRALERDVTSLDRGIAMLLTVFWHERSVGELAERYPDSTLWVHERNVDRVTARVTNPFTVDDELPGGVSAIDANSRDEIVYWIADHSALVTGDVVLGTDDGGLRVCPDSWLPDGVAPRQLRDSLRPLLELPVERVLVSHGDPVLENARPALARALS